MVNENHYVDKAQEEVSEMSDQDIEGGKTCSDESSHDSYISDDSNVEESTVGNSGMFGNPVKESREDDEDDGFSSLLATRHNEIGQSSFY